MLLGAKGGRFIALHATSPVAPQVIVSRLVGRLDTYSCSFHTFLSVGTLLERSLLVSEGLSGAKTSDAHSLPIDRAHIIASRCRRKECPIIFHLLASWQHRDRLY